MKPSRQNNPLEAGFGVTLRCLREKQNLTQEELAFNCGIHRTYVSQLERGLKSPTLRLLWQLCDCLKTTPGDFVSLLDQHLKQNGGDSR